VAVTKYKQQGNCHELAVALKITELGGAVSWPYGDGQAYDLVADFNGKINRVQVKGTHLVAENGTATVSLLKGSRRMKAYNSSEIDVMIACTPLGKYVIPIRNLKLTALTIWPVGTRKRQPAYDPFKEAWHLLR